MARGSPPTGIYIGRGASREGLAPSKYGNPWKVPKDGTRKAVVDRYRRHLWGQCDCLGRCPFDPKIRDEVDELSGAVLMCHCPVDGPCHAVPLIEYFCEKHDLPFRLELWGDRAGRTMQSPSVEASAQRSPGWQRSRPLPR